MSGFALICCIVNMGDASKVMKHARKYGVNGGTISLGVGTVHSPLLDFLSINETRKEVVTMVIEDELASAAIQGIGQDMHFHKHHHGIAFSYPVSEFTGKKNIVADRPEAGEVKNSMHKAIFVVVDRGNAEDVIDAAREGGARGGTIIHARGAGVHEVQRFFAVEIEPEKEEVLFIVEAAKKDAIIASIREKMRIDEPGKGIIFVLDVNEVYGLYEDEYDG